jgi:hypothetical protein
MACVWESRAVACSACSVRATMPVGPEVDEFEKSVDAFAAAQVCPRLKCIWFFRPDAGWNNQYLDLKEPKEHLIPWRDYAGGWDLRLHHVCTSGRSSTASRGA